jgi:hypothetical protein
MCATQRATQTRRASATHAHARAPPRLHAARTLVADAVEHGVRGGEVLVAGVAADANHKCARAPHVTKHNAATRAKPHAAHPLVVTMQRMPAARAARAPMLLSSMTTQRPGSTPSSAAASR